VPASRAVRIAHRVVGDPQQPRKDAFTRDLGTLATAPGLEEDDAREVLGEREVGRASRAERIHGTPVALEQHAERVRVGAGEPPELEVAAGVHTDKCPLTRLRFPAVILCHPRHRRLGANQGIASRRQRPRSIRAVSPPPRTASALVLSDIGSRGASAERYSCGREGRAQSVWRSVPRKSPAWGVPPGRPGACCADPVAPRSIASSGDRRWRRLSETAVRRRCR
jgi:hypothetical protein